MKYAVEQSDGKRLGPQQPSRTTDGMKGVKYLCIHTHLFFVSINGGISSPQITHSSTAYHVVRLTLLFNLL